MSILKAKDTQFRLQEDGSVCFQVQESNPLPGVKIAQLAKGESAYKPAFTILEEDSVNGVDRTELRDRLEQWFGAHLKTVLEPLMNLEQVGEEDAAPVKGIAYQVYEKMGIIPREQLEDLIADLDTDMRGVLRSKRIRLGPVLAFIPALNKPAAVRLRAVLWGVYNERALPLEVPKDGIVSFEVDPSAIDKNFYQAVGYPVYGKRAIRIDMLDRVISAVYDAADKGVFRAQHKMAEWLGCPIDDLYEILEAMGHKKIEDAPEKSQEQSQEPESTDGAEKNAVEPEVKVSVEDLANAEQVSEDENKAKSEDAAEKPQAVNNDVKPELALFRLKKGKAFQKTGGFKGGKKPFNKKQGQKAQNKSHKSKGKPKDRGPRVISAGPEKKLENSPFAILGQLKDKK